jgi:YfiH family protein
MITLPLLSRAATIRHGFFTRAGGVSTGLYAGLNCGFGSDDDPAHVAENRARAAARLGLGLEALVTVHQIHSADAVTVTATWPREAAPKADAMVTDRPGIMLGILTADCVPVLFVDAEAGVIGAAHAGWKGALYGVLDATVAAMTALGARRIAAGIGPAIQQHSYEVGPEFPTRFIEADPENARFAVPAARPGHFMFDLPGYVEARLRGLDIAAVERSPLDTRSEEQQFFSYRRATLKGEPDYGRGLSAIALVG